MKFPDKKVMTAGVVLLGISLAGGTAAYMTGFAEKANRVAVGQNTTGIEENFPDPGPTPITENPQYTKKVWISNRTSAEEGYGVDCYVRASISFSNSEIGNAVALQNLNTEAWEYHADGYYYYKNVLKEGESTEPLFTGFSIRSDEVDPSCKSYISNFSISIYEESIQKGNFSNFQDAWGYYLNPVEEI